VSTLKSKEERKKERKINLFFSNECSVIDNMLSAFSLSENEKIKEKEKFFKHHIIKKK